MPANCNWITGDVSPTFFLPDQLPEQIDALTFCAGKVVLGPLKRLRSEQMLEAYKTKCARCLHFDSGTVTQAFRFRRSLFLGCRPYRSAQSLCHFRSQVGTGRICHRSRCRTRPQGTSQCNRPHPHPHRDGTGNGGRRENDPHDRGQTSPEEITCGGGMAATALYLHSPGAISMTGQILKVDGGMSRAKVS